SVGLAYALFLSPRSETAASAPAHRWSNGVRLVTANVSMVSAHRSFRRRDESADAESFSTRNGAVTSAVLVHLTRGIGPLRLALAGAPRAGSAGVGDLLAIRR